MSTLRVGITGGIGSGKTTVCRIFATLGIPIYYADDRAKWLMANDPDLRHELTQLFGAMAYLPNGSLHRSYIAGIVFHRPDRLQALNQLVHPAVGRDSLAWEAEHDDVPYTLREAALLYESGSYRQLDKIITVTAPEALRIQRVMARDGVDEAAVRARMDRQWPEAEKVQRADFVIHNDGRESLIPQVWHLHHQLLERSPSPNV